MLTTNSEMTSEMGVKSIKAKTTDIAVPSVIKVSWIPKPIKGTVGTLFKCLLTMVPVYNSSSMVCLIVFLAFLRNYTKMPIFLLGNIGQIRQSTPATT